MWACLGTTALAMDGKVKVGMITTLSGGGAGLGIDVRDGFLLAAKMAGNDNLEIVVEDDQRKPDIAVQLADKMIQSEKVDVLTGIIWSNLAMAVVPVGHRAGQILPVAQCGPLGTGRERLSSELLQRRLAERQPARGRRRLCQHCRVEEQLHSGAQLSGRQGRADRLQAHVRGRAGGRGLYRAGPDGLRQRDCPDPGQWRGQRLLLPARRHGDFLPQAICRQSGLELPVVGPAFSFDQGILQAVGDAALGVKNTSQWNKDIDNPANMAFVEAFQAEYGRLPSLYASSGL